MGARHGAKGEIELQPRDGIENVVRIIGQDVPEAENGLEVDF
jgi:hypothetical protein